MIIFTPKEIIDLLALRFEIPKIKGISKKTFKNIIHNKTTPRESTLDLIITGLEERLVSIHVDSDLTKSGAKQLFDDLRQLDKKGPLDWGLLVEFVHRERLLYEECPPVSQTESLVLLLEEVSSKLRGFAKDNEIKECKKVLRQNACLLSEWNIAIDLQKLSRVKNMRGLRLFTTFVKIESLLAIISMAEKDYYSLVEYHGKSRFIKLAPKLRIVDAPGKNEKRIVLKRPVSIWFDRVKRHMGYLSINAMAVLVTGVKDEVPTQDSQKRQLRRWKNGQYPSWKSISEFIKGMVDDKYPHESEVDKFDCFVDGLMSFTVARLIEAAFLTGVFVTQKVIPGVDAPLEGYEWDEKLVKSYYQHFNKVLKGHMRW